MTDGGDVDRPTIIVSGLGRCGSSLLMQMLFLSGLRCAGSFPDFEQEGLSPGDTVAAEWARSFDAVKIIAPNYFQIEPMAGCVVVWLDRMLREQAKSHVKMLRAAGVDHGRDSVNAIALRLAVDREQSLALFDGLPLLRITFESLIRCPRIVSTTIADFASVHGISLDVDRMVSAPRRRGRTDYRCAPDLSMEARLLEESRANG
jgi:hypothetical protein